MTAEIDTPGKILRAAARLFRLHGIGDTTLRNIAQEADVLLGTVHYWFPAKEAILLGLTERAAQLVKEAIDSAVDGETDPTRRLWLAFKAYLTVLLSDLGITTVLLYEYRPRDGEAWAAVTKLREEYDRIWDGLIQQAIGGGQIRPGLDVQMIRLFALGAVNWVPKWYSEDGDYTPAEIASQFADFFARGVFVHDQVDRWISETNQDPILKNPDPNHA